MRKAKREAESCFLCDVEFQFWKELEIFNDQLEGFKAHPNTTKVSDTYSIDKEDIVNSGFGEKSKCDQLIVMDDISGLAGKSKKIENFLIVAHKFNYMCLHFSHYLSRNIYPKKSIWRRILLRKNIFNTFPASVSSANVQKSLEGAVFVLENVVVEKQESAFHNLHFGSVDFLLNW